VPGKEGEKNARVKKGAPGRKVKENLQNSVEIRTGKYKCLQRAILAKKEDSREESIEEGRERLSKGGKIQKVLRKPESRTGEKFRSHTKYHRTRTEKRTNLGKDKNPNKRQSPGFNSKGGLMKNH